MPRSSPPQNSKISSIFDPAPEQRGVVAIGGEQNVLVTHGAGDADRHRLLAERYGIGPEPAGALQRHGLQIEGARQHHRPIKPDEQAGIGGEGRELPIDRAVRREIAAAAHLEARDHRELLVWVPTFGHVTDSRLEELLIGGRYLMAPMVKPATKSPLVKVTSRLPVVGRDG